MPCFSYKILHTRPKTAMRNKHGMETDKHGPIACALFFLQNPSRDQKPQAQNKDRYEANTAWKRTNTDRPRVCLVFTACVSCFSYKILVTRPKTVSPKQRPIRNKHRHGNAQTRTDRVCALFFLQKSYTRDQRPQTQSKDRCEANTAWKRTNTDQSRVRLDFLTKS